MTRRVYIHIGWSKTGSTAIQETLCRNRALLRDRGLCYPGGQTEHHAVYEVLAGEASPSAQAEAARIHRELSQAKGDVVISSEGFLNIDPLKLCEWVGHADVRIVIYLREQATSLASGYQQEVKSNREARSFVDYAETANVDYLSFIARWAGVFLRDNLLVRIYDKDELVGGDAISDFLHTLRQPMVGLQIPRADVNPSIAGALLEAKRRLNEEFAGDVEELRSLTFEPLLVMSRENQDYRGLVSADQDFIAYIRDRHRVVNIALAQEYLLRGQAFRERPWAAATAPNEFAVEAARLELERRAGLLYRRLNSRRQAAEAAVQAGIWPQRRAAAG